MIKLINVNKYFNKRKNNEIHAINNTSLELDDKGLVTFLGNSGCGKTTLLNAIGGLDNVNSGEIYIDDEKITTRRSGKKDEIRNAWVGYIFQNYNLIEDASVFENVSIVLKMMGIRDKNEIEKRVMFVLERVGMERYKNRSAKMLSGGERQRVGIARAIVKNPKIIIADEPTGNLDSKNTIEIMNIIKAISREKLVILVTHEKEIAKFYASRIIEIVDGKVVSDKENIHDDGLDYHMDNKIYLKDMPVQTELEKDNIKIKYYSDRNDEKLEVKVVVKDNNIYIETSSALGDGSDVVELIDDHYKKISKDVYEDYEFGYDRIAGENGIIRYKSIFNPVTLIVNGFKKVFSYSIIKKILLLGFVMASMFSIYAVSSICGITNINDDEFVNVNKNYLTISTSSVTPEMYEKYSEMEGIDYILPGNSQVNFIMPINDYYQSAGRTTSLSGSLSSTKLIDEALIIAGSNAHEKYDLVIDKIIADQLFDYGTIKMVGVDTYEKLVGRKVNLPGMKEFTIVGVTDQGSPSIYVSESLLMQVLQCQVHEDSEYFGYYEGDTLSAPSNVVNYNLVKNNDEIEIYAGRAPENDYEAIVSDNYQYELYIGSVLETKVNGQKLTVCGFYTDKRNNDKIYVNETTATYMFMENQKNLTISPKNKKEVLEKLSGGSLKITDNYENDKAEYIKSIRRQIIATVAAGIVIIFISLVEIYLMLRSSFLSRIKEVGVLRAIGLKKKDIYKMFMGEIIAITSLTTLPGMAVMAYILNGLESVPYIGNQFMMNPIVFAVSFILVFGFNMAAGLLPVFNCMRKTPAEILSRNDVN